MAGLRAALTDAGFTDVQTIGQSGNVLVTATAHSWSTLEKIAAALS